MTLRARISRGASLTAGLVRYIAFVETQKEFIETHRGRQLGKPSQTFPVKSKDEADKIADALGARTCWRDGYYMAENEGVDIYFAPLITRMNGSTR